MYLILDSNLSKMGDGLEVYVDSGIKQRHQRVEELIL